MSSLFARGNKLYAKIQNAQGKWCQLSTGFNVEQREQAERWVRDREREVEREQRAVGSGGGALTVEAYAKTWLKRRKTATVGDDKNRIEKHVVPRIGHLLLVEVRPRHMRDLIEELKAEGTLAPKTIREISGVVHTMFKSALIEELVQANPVAYERGVLPKKLDKDPSWRRQAIYARAEVEQLLSDERIPRDRRVLYALKFFTGRHKEVSGLVWSQWDPTAQPLGSLAIDKTKTGVPRLIPVHPTLAKVLAAWKLEGWHAHYGRKPKADDLIAPNKLMRRRSASEAQKQLVYDLGKIGLRIRAGEKQNRRGHDLRRTLITLARSDGAIDSLLRWITHGPRPSEILDVYSSPPWENLCAEMAKLKIGLLEGKVLHHEAFGAAVVQSRKTGARAGKEAVYERPQRDSNQSFSASGETRKQ